jgi:hypothetical protein
VGVGCVTVDVGRVTVGVGVPCESSASATAGTPTIARPRTVADPVDKSFRIDTLPPQVGITLSTLQSFERGRCHAMVRIRPISMR